MNSSHTDAGQCRNIDGREHRGKDQAGVIGARNDPEIGDTF